MHKKLLIPGPTEVSQEILKEQTHPLIGNRDKQSSKELIKQVPSFYELLEFTLLFTALL